MSAKMKTEPMLHGHAKHRRIQSDYMASLLDAVPLAEWREVVNGALTAAKSGDAQARAWLAQYLVGRPGSEAPTPLQVIAQQVAGDDPLVERLAEPHIDRSKYPLLHMGDDGVNAIKKSLAAELAERIESKE